MARFMFLQRGGCENPPKMTPAEKQDAMQAMMEWVRNGTDEGWLLDPGSGLRGEGAVVQSDLSVTDGPFVESKELVGGYSIVEAVDLSAACELAKQTMTVAGAGRIEVRELMNPGP